MAIASFVRKFHRKVEYALLRNRGSHSTMQSPEPHITELSDDARQELISRCLEDISSHYEPSSLVAAETVG